VSVAGLKRRASVFGGNDPTPAKEEAAPAAQESPSARERGRKGRDAAAGLSKAAAVSAPEAAGGGAAERVTVYATIDQLECLEEDRRRVRLARRTILGRTAMIRGLIEGYIRSGIDVVAAGVATEEDLARLIACRLGAEHE
jgi:hypothetical protein